MTRETATYGARRDVAADITAKILAELERGVLPWRKPWDAARAAGGCVMLPRRATGEPYRGVNVLLLWGAATAHGYASPTWLSFKQAQKLGGHVRTGERGEVVVYYGRASRTRTDTAGAEADDTFRFLKSYVVFNAEQIAALPERFCPNREPVSPSAILPEDYEAWFARFGVERIRTRGIACYWPSRDAIGMPPVANFDSVEHAMATELHEIGHMSGHSSRLDRDLKRFCPEQLAAEEMIAEIFSAVAGTYFNLPPAHLHDHAAYVGSWIKVLKNDKRAFFAAAAKAQQAVDWMLTANPPPSVLAEAGEARHVAA